MFQITAEMRQTAKVTPAQVGNGRTVHYVGTDGFHSNVECDRPAERVLDERDAVKMGRECGRCVKAVLATVAAAEAAAEQEAADAEAPAATKRYRRTENGTTTYLTQAAGEREIERLRAAYARDQIRELFAGPTGATYTTRDGLRIHLHLEDIPAWELAAETPATPAPERFYVEVEHRLAYPGHHEDRLTITRVGYADPIQYIALPRDTARSSVTVLGALGWALTDGLEYIAGPNLERGQIKRVPPVASPEAQEIRDAVTREAVARATALGQNAGGRHFRVVMTDGERYPIGWTYRTVHSVNCAYGWVTAKGRGMDRVGIPTREEADAIVRDWHATGKDTPTDTRLAEVLGGLPADELGGVNVALRRAAVNADAPVRTGLQARDAVAASFPTADRFEEHSTEEGDLLGFTFQVGKLHGARYGWVTRDGAYGKSLERYRSGARDMLPAQVADGLRAAGQEVIVPASTYEEAPAAAPDAPRCVHGFTERPGDTTAPAAACAAKESAVSVGVFSDEGCVDSADCAVQAAEITERLNREDETAREAAAGGESLYRWAVLCGEHEEQSAATCTECAADTEDGEEDGGAPGDDGDEDGPAAPAAPVTFAEGDRIVCADGVARTVRGMVRTITDEPALVEVEDGTQWIAGNCLRANPRDLGEALAASSVAASRVASNPDPTDPEWQAALAELTGLIEFLKAADPITRAVHVKEAAVAVHADAHDFQEFTRPGTDEVTGWSFRAGHGHDARYGVATADGVSPAGLYEYRTTAERAHLYGGTVPADA